MGILKAISLMAFSLGIATMTKYYDFAPWVEANTWIALPMILLGAVGIVLLFNNDW